MSVAAKVIEAVRLELQFIRRRANELQRDFEICDDINLAVIAALKALGKFELDAEAVEDQVVAA